MMQYNPTTVSATCEVDSMSVQRFLGVISLSSSTIVTFVGLQFITQSSVSFSIYYTEDLAKFCHKFFSWKVRCGHLAAWQKIIITTINYECNKQRKNRSAAKIGPVWPSPHANFSPPCKNVNCEQSKAASYPLSLAAWS